MGLKVRYLPDNGPGLEDKAKLIEYLRSESSNGGDGRCLCGGCIATWVLRHFIDNPDAEWEVDEDGLPRMKS